MQMGRLFDIMAAIVGVALALVIVSHPETAKIITAGGNAFTGALKAAIGGSK